MPLTLIQSLLGYSDWANQKVLESLAQLPQAELEKPFTGTFSTLLGGMAHIAVAESIWLQRWKGESPRAAPEWVANAGLEMLGEKLREIREERNERMARLDEKEINRRFRYTNLKGDVTWDLSVGELLVHVANHGTHHRGQLVSMIRQLGFIPPPTDFISYASRSGE